MFGNTTSCLPNLEFRRASIGSGGRMLWLMWYSELNRPKMSPIRNCCLRTEHSWPFPASISGINFVQARTLKSRGTCPQLLLSPSQFSTHGNVFVHSWVSIIFLSNHLGLIFTSDHIYTRDKVGSDLSLELLLEILDISNTWISLKKFRVRSSRGNCWGRTRWTRVSSCSCSFCLYWWFNYPVKAKAKKRQAKGLLDACTGVGKRSSVWYRTLFLQHFQQAWGRQTTFNFTWIFLVRTRNSYVSSS